MNYRIVLSSEDESCAFTNFGLLQGVLSCPQCEEQLDRQNHLHIYTDVPGLIQGVACSEGCAIRFVQRLQAETAS